MIMCVIVVHLLLAFIKRTYWNIILKYLEIFQEKLRVIFHTKYLQMSLQEMQYKRWLTM